MTSLQTYMNIGNKNNFYYRIIKIRLIKTFLNISSASIKNRRLVSSRPWMTSLGTIDVNSFWRSVFLYLLYIVAHIIRSFSRFRKLTPRCRDFILTTLAVGLCDDHSLFTRYRQKSPKVDASIFDSALSHTRRSDASENSGSTFGRFRLWTSFESSHVSVKLPYSDPFFNFCLKITFK